MNLLTSTPKDLFFSKNDINDPRLGECATTQNSSTADFHIIGYPDDEGIKNNFGRIGAAQAPDTIRKYLYKMTIPHNNFKIMDHGNLNPNAFNLKTRHEKLIEYLKNSKGNSWVGLGGGHDYGYVDGSNFLEMIHNNRPLIINLDAHLDVRPDNAGINSGTPFYRLKQKYKDNFDMVQIGIQPQCNSKAHIKWCEEHNISIIGISELRESGLTLSDLFIQKFSSLITKNRNCFLSIDIDGFSSTLAPGCSQSWPSGLEYNEVYEFTQMLYRRLDVKCLGVYEVSPPLDYDNLTSRLAALLVYNFITHKK